MSGKIRSVFLLLTVIAVLLFNAMGPTTVYADDGTTGDTSTTQTSGGKDTSDEEETTDVEPTATAEPVVSADDATTTETATADTAKGDEGSSNEGETTDVEPTATAEPALPTEEAVTTDTPTTDATGAVTTVEETAPAADTSILEQVPENTTVAVLDANGQPQPLATAESANAIEVTSDPIWCPATQATPTPGANGCTASFTSFTDLLTELAGNPLYQGAGTIYVQQGQYNGGESTIDFNSFDLSNISNSNLTVQGGWNTATNVVDLATTSNFTVPIIIGSSANPWGGSLSINNIVITDTNQTGLTVFSQIDVNINNSRFERNREKGADITAGRDVSIANSSFSNPGTNRLQRVGVDITSGGFVSLFDVIANGNREVGANIVADGRVAIGGSFIGGSSFSGMKSTTTTTCPGGGVPFCGFGLNVETLDSIDISNVVANDNFLWGANLNAGIDVNIVDSIFNGNSTGVPTFIDDTGLFITSGGNVAITNVQANNNRLYGAKIDAVGDVAIADSFFSNNTGITLSSGGVPTFHGDGLWVVSGGGIDLFGVTASNNMLSGAHLEAAGDVVIANSSFNNNTTGSATDALGVGLFVISGQSVFIGNPTGTTTVTFNGNQLAGANIQAAGDIFLDFITATTNGTNGVETNATCTNLNGGTLTGNGQYGLSLTNPALNQTGSPVLSPNGLGDIFPPAPGPCPVAVAVSGNTALSNQSQFVSLATISANSFANATGKNLGSINSSAISLNNLFANNYQLIGVSTSSSGNVTTLGIFTGKYAYIHSDHGLQIVLLQPISYTGVWASGTS